MAVHWRPVGPLPAATYWWRRTVLIVLVLVPLLLLRSCGGDPPPQARSTPTATPTAVATASATPTRSATAVPSCQDGELGVTVTASPETSPTSFLVTVTNRSARACRRDLGPGVVDLVVTSGSDRIWSRTDCTKGTARELATLAAGASRGVRVLWDGRRSLPGCSGPRAAAEPGTYRVAGKVASKPVPAVVFRVR